MSSLVALSDDLKDLALGVDIYLPGTDLDSEELGRLKAKFSTQAALVTEELEGVQNWLNNFKVQKRGAGDF